MIKLTKNFKVNNTTLSINRVLLQKQTNLLEHIKINVSKNEKNNELQLNIHPILFTQRLFLNEQGQFDVEKIKLLEEELSFIETLNPDGITLTIPGVEGIVTLQPDGSLIVVGLNSKSAIVLNTFGNVVINGPVGTKSLALKGKKVEINDAVLAQDILIL